MGVHQGSLLSALLFAIVADVIKENGREGLMKEILHADNTVLMSESIKNLRKSF